MSRSYRQPYATCGYGSKGRKECKREASKSVRRNEEVSNGGNYKKSYNSWDICDYRFYSDKSKYSRK